MHTVVVLRSPRVEELHPARQSIRPMRAEGDAEDGAFTGRQWFIQPDLQDGVVLFRAQGIAFRGQALDPRSGVGHFPVPPHVLALRSHLFREV